LFFFHYFINLVIGLAANKSDLFDKEQVPEAEARKYAQEIGAVFKLTSACTAAGIEELFKSIGCKYLDPNYKDDEDSPGSSSNNGGNAQPMKLDAAKAKENKKKKGCC